MKIIINIFIIFLILIVGIYLNRNNLDLEKERLTIDNEVIEEEYQDIEEQEKVEKPVLSLGYLIIERLGIKNFIFDGTNNEVLDKNVIGIHKASVSLDEVIGNIILAGHNNQKVFGNLKNIELHDEIILLTDVSCYKFKVIDITVYNKDDYSYYKYIDDKKLLTLITCYGNNNYRLVITAKEV